MKKIKNLIQNWVIFKSLSTQNIITHPVAAPTIPLNTLYQDIQTFTTLYSLALNEMVLHTSMKLVSQLVQALVNDATARRSTNVAKRWLSSQATNTYGVRMLR